MEFRDGLATGRLLPGLHEETLGATVVRPPATLIEHARNGSAPRTLSVPAALAGKRLLLVGVTGFIGKVWLASLLRDVPDLGRIFVLLRSRGARRAAERFEQMVHGSPVFEELAHDHGDGFAEWLAHRVEVAEGDVTAPDLGLEPEDALDDVVPGSVDAARGRAARRDGETPRPRRGLLRRHQIRDFFRALDRRDGPGEGKQVAPVAVWREKGRHGLRASA